MDVRERVRLCAPPGIWQDDVVKRVLWVMVAAGALVWAGALLDFGRAHDGPRRASQSATDAAPEPAERTSARANERSGAAQASAKTAAPAPSPSTSAANARSAAAPDSAGRPRPGQGDVRVVGSRPSATAVPAAAARTEQGTAAASEQDALRGELGEGVRSPEYVEIEEGYVNEPRDGPWATAEEQRVRAVLGGSAVAKDVALVHCQDTVCKIVLQTDSADAFERLVQVPGISAATGIGPSTPYSLRGGQLSVYFRGKREGNAPAGK
jgi:hypothetical protein